MAAITLDTLKVAKRLRDAGFSEAQAESVTEAIRESVSGQDVVTKAQLDSGLAGLKADLKAEISEAKADITKRIFGAMLAQGALVVTLIKLLPGG